MEGQYEEAIEEILSFTRRAINTSDMKPIHSISFGIVFDYAHDRNQFKKEVIKRANEILPDDLVFDFICVRIQAVDDMNLYGVVVNIFRKTRADLYKPYLPLRYISMCPLAATGILDPNNQSNKMISGVYNAMFNMGTGLSKNPYTELVVHWVSSNPAETENDIVEEIEVTAKRYGLKIFTINYHKQKYTKFYVYQIDTPEMNTIIRRYTTIKAI
jgi:hypothetical protein